MWESVDLIDEGAAESPVFADDGDLIVGNFSSVMPIDHMDGITVWQSDRRCPTSNGCEAAFFDDRQSRRANWIARRPMRTVTASSIRST